MSQTILRRPAVEARTGLSRSSLYRMIQEKSFPSPIRIGARAVGWESSIVDQWIQDRISESREAS
jgi:prophage regulatory protein